MADVRPREGPLPMSAAKRMNSSANRTRSDKPRQFIGFEGSGTEPLVAVLMHAHEAAGDRLNQIPEVTP